MLILKKEEESRQSLPELFYTPQQFKVTDCVYTSNIQNKFSYCNTLSRKISILDFILTAKINCNAYQAYVFSLLNFIFFWIFFSEI